MDVHPPQNEAIGYATHGQTCSLKPARTLVSHGNETGKVETFPLLGYEEDEAQPGARPNEDDLLVL